MVALLLSRRACPPHVRRLHLIFICAENQTNLPEKEPVLIDHFVAFQGGFQDTIHQLGMADSIRFSFNYQI